MDTLVYSEMLDEWCTHSGIDKKPAEREGSPSWFYVTADELLLLL